MSQQISQAGVLIDRAEIAAGLLKALSNKDRLQILCYLAEQERNVSDLEALLGLRQPTLSQQLARLRADSLVKTRREGKAIYYSLASDEVTAVIGVLADLYCDAPAGQKAANEETGAHTEARGKKQRSDAAAEHVVTALAS